MQRTFWICAFSLLLTARSYAADDSCTFKPGKTKITIDLRSGNKGFEPACQPLRIRVNDKTPVTLEIRDISPVEVCSASSKAPTVTTVANPLETIINTITGLKSLSLETATSKVNAMDYSLKLNLHNFRNIPSPQDPDQLAQSKFIELAKDVYDLSGKVAGKQLTWQKTYQVDLTDITNYAAQDYRGALWSKFDPDKDLDKIHKQADVTTPTAPADLDLDQNPPSEIDYAQIQSDVDQMKTIQSRFAARCSATPAPVAPAPGCDLGILADQTSALDQATAILTVLQDNFKTLQTAQTAVTSSFGALEKVYTDFINRKDTLKLVRVDDDTQILYQKISLPFDYGATDTGTITCSTDTTPAVPTTDTINYTILYQNVPALTVSTGLMVTFLQKNEYGTAAQYDGPTSVTATNPNGTYTEYFRITDSARASVFPMAFVNFKIGSPTLKTYWGQPNTELVFTNNLSAGIGVNSNSGTNQPEFFAGYAVGFNKVLVHVGAHFGRVESLGGGFTVDTPVPASFTSSTPVPIDWHYQTFIGIGLSVRIAPW